MSFRLALSRHPGENLLCPSLEAVIQEGTHHDVIQEGTCYGKPIKKEIKDEGSEIFWLMVEKPEKIVRAKIIDIYLSKITSMR